MVAVVDRYNLVKALHSLLYARLWSAMFSGGTQHVLSRYQNKKKKCLLSQMGIELTTCHISSHKIVPLCLDWSQTVYIYFFI